MKKAKVQTEKIEDPEKEQKKQTVIRVLSLVALLSIVVTCVVLWFYFGERLLNLVKDISSFKKWMGQFRPWSAVVFTAIRAMQTVVKFIPAEPLEIGSGVVFGWFGGMCLCLLGSVIGSIVILILTRHLGVRVLELFRLRKKLQSMRFLQNREKRNILLIIFFLIPGSPKDVITYFVGLTDINLVEFMIIASIARIPSIVSSTICGAYLGENNYVIAAAVFAGTTIFSLVGAFAYKKISGRYTQNGNRQEKNIDISES